MAVLGPRVLYSSLRLAGERAACVMDERGWGLPAQLVEMAAALVCGVVRRRHSDSARLTGARSRRPS
jgi:hypothetical protein